MKKELIFAFILFLVTEFILRTFVKEFKYHEVGYLIELLPLTIATFVTCFFARKIIYAQNFRASYLKLSFASIFGILIAKTILFCQWYLIIVSEYRNINGDMQEGLAWAQLDFFIEAFEILIL